MATWNYVRRREIWREFAHYVDQVGNERCWGANSMHSYDTDYIVQVNTKTGGDIVPGCAQVVSDDTSQSVTQSGLPTSSASIKIYLPWWDAGPNLIRVIDQFSWCKPYSCHARTTDVFTRTFQPLSCTLRGFGKLGRVILRIKNIKKIRGIDELQVHITADLLRMVASPINEYILTMF